jgi:glycosyltransferase involved in cell wall biosynthesis
MADHVRCHRIVPADKLRVIQNGIDLNLYRQPRETSRLRGALGIPPDARVIGTIGRLNEIKRQDVLLRAFARVRQQVQDAHLLLVGDGPLRHELAALAAGLGLTKHVHFAGFQADTTTHLRLMDVFALTSRSEGMPQAAIEASVAGIPVIASRVGGLPELIVDGRTGMLFTPGNVEELGAGVVRLLGDRPLAEKLAQGGRARAEGMFDIGRMAGEYHRDFLTLLRRAA